MRRAAMLRGLLIVLFGSAILAALVYVNLQFTRTSSGGNDFLPRWLGTRLLITQHQDPYSAETTAAIQKAMYGRAAKPGEDQALFAYPLYASIFFAPFSLISDYPTARALWLTLLEIATVATAITAIALAGWKPRRWALGAFLLFSLVWFHGTKPLVDGNASVLVGLLLSLALQALKRGQVGAAGALFALSTIKPQVVVLVLFLSLIWAFSVRKKLIFSFLIALLVLAVASFLVQRSWLLESIGQALLYQNYSPPGTVFWIFAQWWGGRGYMFGFAISAGFALLLLYEWWAALGKEYDWFLWTVGLTLILGPLAGLPSTTSNYVVFLIVLPVLFASWQRRVGAQNQVWLHLGFLFIVPWALFLSTLGKGAQFRENLVLFFPVPLFLLASLYWQRWWLKRSPGQPVLQAREV